MTVKFSIRHHYKEMPIEITVEALSIYQLTQEFENTIEWITQSRELIDRLYEATKKLTEREEKP